jgi:DNA polymerase-1
MMNFRDTQVRDTMVMAFLLSPQDRRTLLSEVAQKYIGKTVKEWKNTDALSELGEEELLKMVCSHPVMMLKVLPVLEEKLRAEGLWEVYEQIEAPLLPVLLSMEYIGIRLDSAFLGEMSKEVGEKLTTLEKTIYALAGKTFAIHSPKQLQEILFHDLGLPPSKKTKTGYSTNVDVLEGLRSLHPLPGLLLEYRQLAKLQSTYIESLPKMVNGSTGRVHTYFHQTGATTGRLSSTDPNLQNIPIRTEIGKRIRKAFIAEDGYTLVAADYSQIELRLFAHFSSDPELTKAFLSGGDIHTYTASLVLKKLEGEVTPEERRAAKTINFGIIYGMGAFRLSQELGITRAEAERFIAAYFETYKGVREYMDRAAKEAEQELCVRTLFGRKRYLPELQNANRIIRDAALREAINAPLQGTAADLIKLAMIRLFARFAKEGLGARMVLQVHDELVFEVPHGEVERTLPIIREEMEQVATLSVPLKVDIGAGENWFGIH